MRTDSLTAPVTSTSPAGAAGAEKATATTTAAVAGYSASRTLDLTVKTREGDTVTISSAQTTAVGAAGVTGATGAVVKSTSRSLSISVEGDLSKDELADLQHVLKALAQAGQRQHARGLHRGHGHHHDHGRHRGQSLSTIESISASMTTSFAVIGGTLIPGATGATGAAGATEGAAPETETPAAA
jgi:hypothetical protein